MSKKEQTQNGQVQSNSNEQDSLFEGQTNLSRSILENHPDFIGVGNLEGRALYVNPAGLKMMGLPHDHDVSQMSAVDFYALEDAKRLTDEGIQIAIENGKWTSEANLLRADGSLVPVEQTININFDSEGEPLHFSITMRDISERKQAAARQRLLTQAFEFSNNPIVLADAQAPDMPLIYVNSAFEAVTGYSPDEVIGKNCRFLQGEDDAQEVLEELRAAIDEKRPCEVLLRNYKKDGTFFWNQLRLSPIFDDAGVMTHILGLQTDVTKMKLAQEDLSQLYEFSPEAVGIVNTQTGLFENVNQAAEKLYGLPRKELVQVGPDQMSPEFQENGRSSAEAAGEKIGQALAGGSPVFEWLHKNGQGDIVQCEVRLVGLPAPRSHLVRFSATDISERLNQRKVLQAAQEDLSQMLETSPDAIGLVNTNTGRFESVNVAAEKIYGVPREELTKLGPAHFVPEYQPDGRLTAEVAATELAKAQAGEKSEFEYVLKNKAGKLIPVEISLVGLPADRNHLVRFSISDISERKNKEKLLLENQQALERLASELQTISEISTEISSITDEKLLLQKIVNVTKERFNLYHAQIYLLDEKDNQLKLAAASGRVGKRLLARGHQISMTRQNSIVARAAREKTGIRVNNVQANGTHLPNPMLPKTRAEMALPMLLGDELIGVLDVQADVINRFKVDDVNVKTTLAAQTAVALQNARRYTETQELLKIQKTLAVELENERNTLQAIINALPGYVYAKDRQSRFLWANTLAAQAMGVESSEQLEGKTDLDFYPQEIGEKFYNDEQRLFASGESLLNIEERSIDQTTQEETWLSTSKVLMRDENGQISGLVGIGLDITQQKIAARRNEQQAEIIRNARIVIGATTPDGKAIFMNRYGLDLFGYDSLDEVAGQHILEFHARHERQRFEDEILPTLFAEGAWRGETEFLATDGQLIPVEQFMFLIRDDDGNVQLIGTSATDISERKEAAAALQQANRVVENSPVILFRWRAAEGWPVEYVSENIGQFGYTPEELLTGETPYASIVHPDDLERVGREVQAYSESGVDNFTQEYRIITKDGQVRWTDDRTVIERDADGNITHYQGIVIDISERQKVEAALQQANRVVENSPLVILRWGAASEIWSIEYVSENINQFGYTSEELLSGETAYSSIVHPDDLRRIEREVEEYAERRVDNFVQGYRIITKDGEVRWLDDRTMIERDADGNITHYQGILIDITERTKVAVALQEREALLQTIVDSLPSWIYVKDSEHRYRLVNDAYSDSMQIAKEKFIGKNDIELGFPEEIVKGNEEKGIRGVWPDDTEVMSQGEMKVIDVEPTVLDGEEAFLRTVKVPLRDVVNNDVWGVLGFVQIITDRIRIQEELQKSKEVLEVRVAERTAELAQTTRQIQEQFEESKKQTEILRKRAAELEIVTHVTEAAASGERTEQLLVNVMDVIKESFHLYHAHIYEMNDVETELVLTYGSGEVGRLMRQKGRTIGLDNEKSLVARAVRTKSGVIENDLQAAPGYLANPLLPDSRSSLAIPLVVGDEVFGAFNVQSDRTDHFSEEDIRIQTTIATQISLALQNVRALTRSDQALKELNAVTRQLTQEGWQNLAKDQKVATSFQYDLHSVRTLPAAEARRGEEKFIQPISVRGATVGELGFLLSNGVDEETEAIVEAVAARLGEHLETLRLTEQTQVALAETALQADKLAELNELGKELNGAQSANELYSIVSQYVPLILNADRVSVAMLTRDGQALELFGLTGEAGLLPLNSKIPVDGTAIGTAIRENRLISTSDTKKSPYIDEEFLAKSGLNSTMCVALTVQSAPLGTLNIGATMVNAFSENDKNLLQQIAALMMSSLENQMLLSQSEAKAERERRVRAITDKIRQRGSREGILQTAREEIAELLRAKETAVHLGDSQTLLQRLKQKPMPEEETLVENRQGQGD